MSADTEAKLESRLWKTLKSDRTVMLALVDVEEGHSQPMTAQLLHEDDERGPIWFFTSKDTDWLKKLPVHQRAVFHFSSKGHDLFASVHGELAIDNNRSVIEKLWNPFVAAWFEGKDDPNLQLIRLDPEHAQIWLNENNIWAVVKLLAGRDPKKDSGDKVAEVELGRQ